ncbi:MAG TPA: class I SAM-dependent methyltransferase [Pyrinomonadaceae bacterium]
MRTLLTGIQRRFERTRRRRKVGRAYDMALEIARVLPSGANVLDIGCGNGFIAHHLSGILKSKIVGLDVSAGPTANIDYLPYDGRHFPVQDEMFEAVLLCYVLHHAHDASLVLNEVTRVLKEDGLVIIYEDIPERWLDRAACWIHNQQWLKRTGACTFRLAAEWRQLFCGMGFEVVYERKLSRWRNVAHPVSRRFFVLRVDRIAITKQATEVLTMPVTAEEAYAAA